MDEPDPAVLYELANYRMPFGKYKGRRLLDLPEAYLVWFQQKGWPDGKLGRLMEEIYGIRREGAEFVLKPFRRSGGEK